MAFENDAAAGNGNSAASPATNDVASPLPNQAPAAPPIPVLPAAPPAQPAPPAAPLPAHENRPTHSFAESIRHALIGGTLGVVAKLAGPPPTDYGVDASGKTVGTPRIDNTTSRLERIARSVLEGLASGSQIGPQKSAGAAWAAGIGAGADAVRQQGQQQDLLKRKQSQEDYETQQRAQVHKATVAMTNAQTHNLWQKIEDDDNAKDTERQKNAGIVNSLNDYTAQNPTSKLTVQTLSEQQALAMREADGHSVAKHTFLPMGKTQAKDADGNPIFEVDGQTPKFVKQFAAIGGSADEKVPLPQVMADDIKKFSKYDPRLKSFADVPAGTMVPFAGFLTAYKYTTENKGREADGWREAKPGENVVTVNGKTMQHNPFTGETREYVGGVPLSVQKEQADIGEKQSMEKKNLAEAKKAEQADNKPVYAFNTQTKQLEQTTRSTVAANPTLYTNPVDVKESDIRKDTELARQLGDAQLNLSRYRAAVNRMDEASYFQNVGSPGGSKRAMASLLGEDKFKAEFMGLELPADWFNKLADTENWNALSKSQQDAVVGYLGARGAVIAYQKAVSGSGRANKEQLALELQNIPTPLLPKDVREAQFDRFQQNVDQTGAGLPKMVGIERPKEIQQRIEAEEAQKQGATHVYDPNEKKAVPVGTWVQRHFQGMPGVKP
jgi:hypothetical protein